MSFTLHKCILTKNDCYKKHTPMKPKGIVVHSTGANNPNLKRYVQPDDGILGYNKNKNDWNRSGVEKCVHGFIGYDKDKNVKCYQTLPFDIACWGCGKGKKGSFNYNPTGHIQFEICEDDMKNEKYFNECFDLAAEFCAYLCATYNLSVDSIVSHKEAGQLGYASNHNDPTTWLKNFGKDMDWFRALVSQKLSGKQTDIIRYVDNVDYEGLNVRYTTTGKKTGKVLPVATEVLVLKFEGNKAILSEKTYVDKRYLSEKKPAYKIVSGADRQGLNVRPEKVNVRPRKVLGIMGNPIACIPNGTRVKVYQVKGKWSKISPNANAWVYSSYLI